MEQSKSISEMIAKFKIVYPYYFKDLDKNAFLGVVALYQESLSKYNAQTISKAVTEILKKSKFMPTISELIEQCELNISYNQNETIERMIKNNYFKNSNEITKAYHFIEERNIPNWLLEDMKKYGYNDGKILLETNEIKKLGV